MVLDPSRTPSSRLLLVEVNLLCSMLGRLRLMDGNNARPWTVCNASGCRRFQNQCHVGSLVSEVRAEHVKRTLLGRPMDVGDIGTTSAVWNGQPPSHWTPTG